MHRYIQHLLLCLAALLTFSFAGAAQLDRVEGVVVITCDNVEDAIKLIQQDNDAETNPLLLMMPKADCWLLRTKKQIVDMKIDQILPAVVVPLGLAGFVVSIIGASASGVPRRIVETAIQGMVGGILITASLPTPSGQGPIPTMITKTWVEMYKAVATASGPEINKKVKAAGDNLIYVIGHSPLALIGGEAVGGIKALQGMAKFGNAFRKTNGQIVKLTDETATLRAQAAQHKADAEEVMATISDPKQRSQIQANLDEKLRKLDKLIAGNEEQAGQLNANRAQVGTEAIKDTADKFKQNSGKNIDSVKQGLQWATLAVLPMLLAYAGAIYASGIVALAMALAAPMMGVAVIFGRGGIILSWLSSMLSNLLVIAVMPIAFMIAIDIAFVAPMIAMKGFFAGFRESGVETVKAIGDLMQSSIAAGPGVLNPFAIGDVIRDSMSFISSLAQTLGMLAMASIIGVVLMLMSIGMALQVMRTLPGVVSKLMDGVFDSIGSNGNLGAAFEVARKAVFKTGGEKSTKKPAAA